MTRTTPARCGSHLLFWMLLAASACDDGRATPPSSDVAASDSGAEMDATPSDADSGDDDVGGSRDCFSSDVAAWHSCRGGLFDPQGRRVFLRGVNVAQSRKLAPYQGGTSDRDYAAMRRLGFNHIRLLWSWAAAMPARDELDAEYLDQLEDEVRRAGEFGLLVVVDAHQDLFGEAIRTENGAVGNGAPVWACPPEIAETFTEPVEPWFANYGHPAVQGCFDYLYQETAVQASFARAWAAVAERVGDQAHVVGYDLWNEPYWGSANPFGWEGERLLPLYERLAAAILEVDEDALLVVEPGANKNIGGTSTLPRPSFARLVYAPHLYSARMEAGDAWNGSLNAFEARLSNDRAELQAWGRGDALYMGEWGTPGRHDNDPDFTSAVGAWLEREGIGSAIWQWGPGGPGSYAQIDAEGEPQPWALAVARPYLSQIAGDDPDVALDETTGELTASWTARSVDVPTVLVVPDASDYAQASWAVSGGTADRSGDRIEVFAAALDTRVEIGLTR